MPIDYDKIVEGRRRNWESLKPEEIREKEREEKREREKREREASGKEGFFARRQRLKDEAAAADKRRFRSTLRQSVLMIGGIFLIAGAYLGISHVINKQREAALRRSILDVQALVEKGTVVLDMSTPVKAFGTWRSAWKRNDMQAVVRLLSPRFLSKTSETASRSNIAMEYERLQREGRMEASRELSLHFENTYPIRIPLPPYRDEELAIFKSGEVPVVGQRGPGRFYIVAFSYSKTNKSWHFADVREAKYFSVKWYMEAMIRPMRIGPGATTYDDTGTPISTRGTRGTQQRPAGRRAPVNI
ncbi:hypothetical protein IT570_08095 [Candidatus Sumerlaeota bacterium]|nr:hypothetical protein [Candidatus Sumerlaeota bacterium]